MRRIITVGVAALSMMAVTAGSANAQCHSHTCRARVAQKRVIAPYRGWLASVRMCESGGDYGINTGNGFYGAYQFTLSSWYAVGGHGFPHLASKAEQDYRAILLLKQQGTNAWPVCG